MRSRSANGNKVKGKKNETETCSPFTYCQLTKQERCEKILKDNIKEVKVPDALSEVTAMEKHRIYSSCKLRGNRSRMQSDVVEKDAVTKKTFDAR